MMVRFTGGVPGELLTPILEFEEELVVMTVLPLLMTVCPSDVRKIATGLATVGGGGGGGGNIPGEKKCGSLVGLFIGGVVELA